MIDRQDAGGKWADVDARVDALLEPFARVLAGQARGYGHHVKRVVVLTRRLAGPATREDHEAIVVAAAFHDIGIWTDATFDYIEPSVARAVAHLGARGQADLAGAVTAMIRHHHQLRRYRGAHAALTEPFRRADAIDVSCGLLRHGVDRGTIAEAYRRWPGAGFHRFLVGQAMRRLRTHPLSPLPMLRW